jgi:hypothetical protein
MGLDRGPLSLVCTVEELLRRKSSDSGLEKQDHLCGLVVRVPGYRSRGPGSIPGATRLSEK